MNGLNDAFANAGFALEASDRAAPGSRCNSAAYGHTAQFSIAWDGTTFNSFAGTDVAGTIDGQAATGSGQQLLVPFTTPGRRRPRARTSPGTTLGDLGTFTYTPGIAQRASTAVNDATDAVSGYITLAQNSLNDSDQVVQQRHLRHGAADHRVPEPAAVAVHQHGDRHQLTQDDRQHAHQRARASCRRSPASDRDLNRLTMATFESRAQQVRERLGAHHVARSTDRRALRPHPARPRARARRAWPSRPVRRAHRRSMHAQEIVVRAAHVARPEAVARRRDLAAVYRHVQDLLVEANITKDPRPCSRAERCSSRCATRGAKPPASSPSERRRVDDPNSWSAALDQIEADLAAIEDALAAAAQPAPAEPRPRTARPAPLPAELAPRAEALLERTRDLETRADRGARRASGTHCGPCAGPAAARRRRPTGRIVDVGA